MTGKTYEEWLEKVRQDGKALSSIPEKIMTVQLCHEAVRNTFYLVGRGLKDVPKKFITEELTLEAIRKYPLALFELPEEFWTAKICLEAVSKIKRWSKCMPEHKPECEAIVAELLALSEKSKANVSLAN